MVPILYIFNFIGIVSSIFVCTLKLGDELLLLHNYKQILSSARDIAID